PRPRESLTPQQLREWYTGWGCRGGRTATAATAVIAATAATTATAATGGGQMQLQRRPRESLTPRQLREWYAQSRGSLSTVRCPYVICTGDRTGQACGTLSHTQSRCFARLSDAWRTKFGDEAELPTWLELLGQGVDIYALDYDAILTAMYALPTSADRACYLCVPPDPGIAPTALGASEAAALGASVSPALGTGEAAASGAAPPSRRSVPVFLADPSGGPLRATSSTVLPCPAVPSGTLSGLYLPSFSTNLVAGSVLQDAGVHQFTPAYECVTHCTCAQTGRHLATFTRQPGSGLYTLTTESPQVAASASAPGSAGGSGAAAGAGVGGSGAAEGAGARGSGAAAGAGVEGSESAVAWSPWSSRLRSRVPLTSQQLHNWYGRRQGRASGAQAAPRAPALRGPPRPVAAPSWPLAAPLTALRGPFVALRGPFRGPSRPFTAPRGPSRPLVRPFEAPSRTVTALRGPFTALRGPL
ncbi:unnamed protein product, partial [Closterium sp. NIES-53]